MAKKRKISLSIAMDILMKQNPQVVAVLFDNHMHCFGCPLAAFHDVSDAAREHGLSEEYLLAEFELAMPVQPT